MVGIFNKHQWLMSTLAGLFFVRWCFLIWICVCVSVCGSMFLYTCYIVVRLCCLFMLRKLDRKLFCVTLWSVVHYLLVQHAKSEEIRKWWKRRERRRSPSKLEHCLFSYNIWYIQCCIVRACKECSTDINFNHR